MTIIAAVRFNETDRSYFYGCDIDTLNKGDKVDVIAQGEQKTVTFVGYTDSEIVGFTPSKTVLGKAKIDDAKLITTKKVTSKRTIRSKQQRELEAKELRLTLQESHPTMLSMREIAEAMDWEVESTSNFIKVSMSLESKIVQVYKGWYTAKL